MKTLRTAFAAFLLGCLGFLLAATPDMSHPPDLRGSPDMTKSRPDLARIRTSYPIPRPAAWSGSGATLTALSTTQWANVAAFAPPRGFPVGLVVGTSPLRASAAENLLFDAAVELSVRVEPPAKSAGCEWSSAAQVVTLVAAGSSRYCGPTLFVFRAVAMPSGLTAEIATVGPAVGSGSLRLRGAPGLGWPLPEGTSSIRWVVEVRGRVEEFSISSLSATVVEIR